jgi:hypothetical protein
MAWPSAISCLVLCASLAAGRLTRLERGVSVSEHWKTWRSPEWHGHRQFRASCLVLLFSASLSSTTASSPHSFRLPLRQGFAGTGQPASRVGGWPSLAVSAGGLPACRKAPAHRQPPPPASPPPPFSSQPDRTRPKRPGRWWCVSKLPPVGKDVTAGGRRTNAGRTSGMVCEDVKQGSDNVSYT